MKSIGRLGPSVFDLSFFWRDSPVWSVANGDYMGPDSQRVLDVFDELLWDDSDILAAAGGADCASGNKYTK